MKSARMGKEPNPLNRTMPLAAKSPHTVLAKITLRNQKTITLRHGEAISTTIRALTIQVKICQQEERNPWNGKNWKQ
eukprot:2283120-Amphidinium_carterae.1